MTIKGKVVNGLSLTSCPYEYKGSPYDIRIGSTWCCDCKRFISKSSTRKETDSVIGTYEITVECKGDK